VTVVFVQLDNTKLELLHPLGEKSPIQGFLDKNKAGEKVLSNLDFRGQEKLVRRSHDKSRKGVIAWCVGGVRTAGQHQAGAVASSRGEVTHPGLPRQKQSRLG
jgi:hypothetical protein